MKDIEARASLRAVGDMVVRHKLYDGTGRIAPAYAATSAWLQGGDIGYGACEVQFTTRGVRTDSPIAYRSAPELCDDLAAAGFTHLSVATNHTGDFGIEGFSDTLHHLRRAGIVPVGGGMDLTAAQEPVICTVNGLRIALVAFSCLLPSDTAATAERPGIAPVRIHQQAELIPMALQIEPGAPIPVFSQADPGDLARVVGALARARADADIVVALPHWGYGRGDRLAAYQRPLAHALVEAGADLVLGSHCHSPAAVEVHRGVPVLYGLGNHFADQDFDTPDLLQQRVFADIDAFSTVAEVVLGSGGVVKLSFRATVCPRGTGKPRLVEDPAEAAPILARLQALSAPLGGALEIRGAEACLLHIHVPA